MYRPDSYPRFEMTGDPGDKPPGWKEGDPDPKKREGDGGDEQKPSEPAK